MLVASGTFLVLISWAVAVGILMSLGLLPAVLAGRGRVSSATLVAACWWGLAAGAVVVIVTGLVAPLVSAAAVAVVVVLAVCSLCAGALVARRRGWSIHARWTAWSTVTVASLALATVYLAVAATGPVTNYDSGLYHLGAIRYAGDHPAIPGLANLYGPLAYATAQFPLAAFLGNGPLHAEGYRLLNGLILVLAALDMGARATRRRRGPGYFVLLVGLAVTLVPLLALSDYWVTSPTQDSAALALTVVAAAALADVAAGCRTRCSVGVVLAVTILLALVRPTMVVFGVVAWVIVGLVALRRRSVRPTRALAGGLVLAAVAVIAVALRDRQLSGWLQYPLSVHAFDVPWRSADPTALRDATLGFARDPGDPWNALHGFGWVGAWLGRLPDQWETYLIALLSVVAITFLGWAARLTTVRWRPLLLCMAPSLVAVAVWWLASPPSFRFVWGPLFTVGVIPIGWALWRLDAAGVAWVRRAAVVGAAAAIVSVTAFSMIARFDWGAPRDEYSWGPIPYSLAEVARPPVVDAVTGGGVAVIRPVETDQCWINYPLCTPDPAPGLRLLGSDWPEGFLP